jgi:hypothetical protein
MRGFYCSKNPVYFISKRKPGREKRGSKKLYRREAIVFHLDKRMLKLSGEFGVAVFY